MLPVSRVAWRLRRRGAKRAAASGPDGGEARDGCGTDRRDDAGDALRSAGSAGAALRRAGTGACAAGAGASRPRCRPAYRRLRLRLSRFAARRPGPGALARGEASGRRRHPLRARSQRGPRGDHALGHPAACDLPGPEGGRRFRPLVRQGPGGRPQRRRAALRQHLRHHAPRRRARRLRRRPRRALLHLPAPDRPDPGRGDDPGAGTGGCRRHRRSRPRRHCALALRRCLGGPEDHRRGC